MTANQRAAAFHFTSPKDGSRWNRTMGSNHRVSRLTSRIHAPEPSIATANYPRRNELIPRNIAGTVHPKKHFDNFSRIRIKISDAKTQKPRRFRRGFFAAFKSLAVSYSRMIIATLPSALSCFTSVFGMGTGGSNSLWPPGKLVETADHSGSAISDSVVVNRTSKALSMLQATLRLKNA